MNWPLVKLASECWSPGATLFCHSPRPVTTLVKYTGPSGPRSKLIGFGLPAIGPVKVGVVNAVGAAGCSAEAGCSPVAGAGVASSAIAGPIPSSAQVKAALVRLFLL